jgi:hypothetical protein
MHVCLCVFVCVRVFVILLVPHHESGAVFIDT